MIQTCPESPLRKRAHSHDTHSHHKLARPVNVNVMVHHVNIKPTKPKEKTDQPGVPQRAATLSQRELDFESQGNGTGHQTPINRTQPPAEAKLKIRIAAERSRSLWLADSGWWRNTLTIDGDLTNRPPCTEILNAQDQSYQYADVPHEEKFATLMAAPRSRKQKADNRQQWTWSLYKENVLATITMWSPNNYVAARSDELDSISNYYRLTEMEIHKEKDISKTGSCLCLRRSEKRAPWCVTHQQEARTCSSGHVVADQNLLICIPELQLDMTKHWYVGDTMGSCGLESSACPPITQPH